MNINERYQTIKEWAYAYRRAGWCVMPLYNYSKSPALVQCLVGGEWVHTWKPLETRMATDEEFDRWFTDSKVTGIGLVCGAVSGIVAIDEDSYKDGGMKFATTSPMVSRTARGGRHLLFRYEEPIKTSGFRKGVNIEIKSDGGFIVLAPSEVFLTPGLTDKGKYRWESFCALNKLPVITEEQLTPYRSTPGGNDPTDISQLSRAPIGTQHNNLRSLALAVFNRFKPNEWAEARSYIYHAASEFVPPHPEDRVEKIIKDTELFVKMHPKKDIEKEIEKLDRENKPIIQPRTIEDIRREAAENKVYEDAAPSTGWPDLDQYIKGFVPTHLYTLTGNENVGKSTVAANFADRLIDSDSNRKVLYIALEPGVKILDYFVSIHFRTPFSEITDELRDQFVVSHPRLKFYVDRDVQDVEALTVALRQLYQDGERFDLVIIDHIGYFVRERANWVQEQGNVVKELAFIAKEQKTAIMMIAHLRKKAPGQKKDAAPTNDDISGSAAFKQDSTEVMIVLRQTDDEDGLHYSPKGKVWVTKTKCGPNGAVHLNFVDGSAYVYSDGESLNQAEGKWSPERQVEEERNQEMLSLFEATKHWGNDEEESDVVKDDLY